MSPTTAERLTEAGLDPMQVERLIHLALDEDLGDGTDVTSAATIPIDQRCVVTFGSRAAGVVAGLPVAAAVIEIVCGTADCDITLVHADGDRIEPGTALARVTAPTRAMLTAERTALNLLCQLAGVATATAAWTDALAGTVAKVRDTRKTVPGMRALQKYAVRCGGGVNHRMGLYDAALVKDNHVAAAGGVAVAFDAVRGLSGTIPVEIEVDGLEGLRIALEVGAEEVLIDNFTTEQMEAAVALRDEFAPSVRLEASGGLTLETAAEVARTGVDYIAVGALTHSTRALDIGLDWDAIV